MEYNARIATKDDKKDIAKLCRRAMGEKDYVIGILNKTIDAGGLFLAFDRTWLIGVANFQKLSDGSAWLSMARTDPDYRGKRVAGFLQKVIALHARNQSIHTLRFLVNSSNTPSIRAAARGGFRPVFETAHISFSLRKKHSSSSSKRKQVRQLQLSDSEAASIVSSSSYLSQLNGYLSYGWHFEKATLQTIRNTSQKGKIFASDGLKTVFLLGCAEIWDPLRGHGGFFILNGALGKTLEIVKECGSLVGFDSIGTFLPYNRYFIRTALKENSFKLDPWADHGIVFERKI